MPTDVYTITLFEDEAVGAGSSATSDTIPVAKYKASGSLSSQLKITGDGEVDVQLYLSNNGEDFVLYDTWYSGYSAGEYFLSHGAAVASEFYVKLAETGGDPVTVSMWLAIQ